MFLQRDYAIEGCLDHSAVQTVIDFGKVEIHGRDIHSDVKNVGIGFILMIEDHFYMVIIQEKGNHTRGSCVRNVKSLELIVLELLWTKI